ncbi:hypothetical protein NCLIV_029950 [Neospora caninum Liverpool]|uniref:Uncharacterized protein n=1 Tax=Neospora caninum (strain Liverpool) TaxID=572307 RepID=F0VHL3_NEOCL|nr:hypothetical protein NCLIV_029950 [Neospora caninum Liverpool]CBZ53207.1 hypothetical protein NCLIV_029950 [Neospora caninum Liverpool]|eukprot:XP_003883239.1 hypothetical protein NCLIV_029950 [Neospora caninum Liverpool]
MFNPKYEEREAHAVNSEHEKNIPNDEERTWLTIRSLAKGPLSRFATGNLETLSTAPKRKGINVVVRLKDFHRKYYCASNMPNPAAMNEVARLAHNLLTYEPYHVLAGDVLLADPDATFVNQLLAKMTPEHAIVAFSDPQFRRNTESFDVEPFYGVEFKINDLPKEQLMALKSVTPAPGTYKVPPALKHVPRPEDLHLRPNIGGMSIPELLGESNTSGGHSVWWQGQGTLPVPRVHANIKARTARNQTNMKSRTQATLLMEAIGEQLDEATVDLKQCGISHSAGVSGDGLYLTFAAYTPQQLRQVMAVVASQIKDPRVEQDRFTRIKQRMIEELEDSASQVAYEHAIAAASVLLRNDANSRKDLLRVLKSDSTSLNETLKTFSDLKSVHADAFIMGNIDKSEATEIVQSFLQDSGFIPIPMKEAAQSLVVEQKAPIEALIANPIPNDVNHATVVQYQLGVPSIEERVNLAVLSQMLNRRLFDRLRTQEQLGYIVGANAYIDSSVESLRCVLEGSRKHPDEVADLIEKELREMDDHIQSLSDGELEHWKEATRAELEKPTETFYEEFGRSWSQIANHGHCFNKRELELIYLKTNFNRKQLSRTYAKLLAPTSRLVSSLS